MLRRGCAFAGLVVVLGFGTTAASQAPSIEVRANPPQVEGRGFPAISADGQVVVFAYSRYTGEDFSNLTVRFVDAAGHLEDVEVSRRTTRPLARRLRTFRSVPFVPAQVVEEQRGDGYVEARMATSIDLQVRQSEASGGNAGPAVITRGASVVGRDTPPPEVRSNDDDCVSCGCYMPSPWLAGFASAGQLVVLQYQRPQEDTCSPPPEHHAVILRPEAPSAAEQPTASSATAAADRPTTWSLAFLRGGQAQAFRLGAARWSQAEATLPVGWQCIVTALVIDPAGVESRSLACRFREAPAAGVTARCSRGAAETGSMFLQAADGARPTVVALRCGPDT